MNTVIGKGLEAFVNQEAREQALAIIDQAREKAERRIIEAEKQSAANVRKSVNAQAAIIQSKEKQAIAQLRLEAHRHLITQQEEIIERVWKRVEDTLRAIAQKPESDRLQVLTTLLLDALAQYGTEHAVIHLSEQDYALATTEQLARWGQLAGAIELVLDEQPASILGGVIVSNQDESIIVDNSFDERLRLVKQNMRDQVGQILAAQTFTA